MLLKVKIAYNVEKGRGLLIMLVKLRIADNVVKGRDCW